MELKSKLLISTNLRFEDDRDSSKPELLLEILDPQDKAIVEKFKSVLGAFLKLQDKRFLKALLNEFRQN